MRKKLLIFLTKLFLIGVLILGLFIGFVYLGVFGKVYSIGELKEFKNESASLVVSDQGKLIGKFFAENRTNVEFDQFPKELIEALIATEDARYFEHEGVDGRSLFRVLIKSVILQQKNSGGGSTITQQLAKNMFGRKNYGFLSMPVNKTKEIILASRLESIYSKEDILTLYLNTVPFGENVLGIEAASHRYFNKNVEDLQTEESAVLVGMLKANTYYNPRLYPEHALQRRNVVLEQMQKYGYLKEDRADRLQQLPLKLDYANLESEGPANYFLVQVKKEAQHIIENINTTSETKYDLHKSGLIIETTLDYDLQQYALQAFSSHLGRMQNRLNRQYAKGTDRRMLEVLVEKELSRLNLENKADIKKKREIFTWDGFTSDSISVRDSISLNLTLLHAGLLAMNPKSGTVKAWVGGIDFRTHPYDQIFAQRQTASAFKPILYASALEAGALPCQYLDNDELILQDFDNWQPRNYDRSQGGKYSIAASLSRSMNIPTVNLFFQVGYERLNETWTNLGFSQELQEKPSVALGTNSASLYEMTIAYAAFSNGGRKVKPVFIDRIKNAQGKVLYQRPRSMDQERVLQESTSGMMSAMLEKAVYEGTGKSMANIYGVRSSLAGKTGTSQDYGDAWFLAYNNDLVIASRVGATYPLIHFNKGSDGAGSTLALPIVAKTLQKSQRNANTKSKYLKDLEVSEVYLESISCVDHIDDSDFEKFFDDLFKDRNTTFEKASKKAKRQAKKEKRKSWFKRLFGKKEKS
ncbi:penicillin-binding protein [Lutimonas saemankumensis]|uniref:transglycosylase domain-containing protein n=1 Tax=Lutimonas saemankumensis TaxID=483016 RepID=UPI001CD66CB9|nr:transglycosylase domain-containing protein [Lutimonas saemankumensis]MCA0933686.1 penicillin-binding protein [Lutimonas saemankumensis]